MFGQKLGMIDKKMLLFAIIRRIMFLVELFE